MKTTAEYGKVHALIEIPLLCVQSTEEKQWPVVVKINGKFRLERINVKLLVYILLVSVFLCQ